MMSKYQKRKRRVSERDEQQPSSSGSVQAGKVDESKAAASKSLQETFLVFDKDKDGYINAQDIRDTMTGVGVTLSDEDVKAMLRRADVGPNGILGFKGMEIPVLKIHVYILCVCGEVLTCCRASTEYENKVVLTGKDLFKNSFILRYCLQQ